MAVWQAAWYCDVCDGVFFAPGTFRDLVIVGERETLAANFGTGEVKIVANRHVKEGGTWKALDGATETHKASGPEPLRHELKLFLDACPGGYQQMIVTTHETHLLDLDLLRRDEIWFIEKDKHQQSRLTSLGNLKARKDLRIEKGYLQGRFGGIPFIGDTKKLMDMIHCPANGKQHEKKASS